MKLTIVPQPKQMDFYGNIIDVSAFFNHEAQLFLQNRDKRLTYHAKRLCSALIEKENVYHGFHLVFGGGEEQIQKNSFEKCQQYIDAYRLDVNAQGISISAASPQGLFLRYNNPRAYERAVRLPSSGSEHFRLCKRKGSL